MGDGFPSPIRWERVRVRACSFPLITIGISLAHRMGEGQLPTLLIRAIRVHSCLTDFPCLNRGKLLSSADIPEDCAVVVIRCSDLPEHNRETTRRLRKNAWNQHIVCNPQDPPPPPPPGTISAGRCC